MKRFKEFLTEKEAEAKKESPIMLLAYFHGSDRVASAIVEEYLVEGGKVYDIGRGYKAAFHRAHVPGTQNHLHFSFRGRDLYSINQDGTAHDTSHGKRLHNQVVDGMRNLFPNFKLPPNNIIESFLKTEAKLLVEAAVVAGEQMVDPELITTAMNKATISGK
jgi:hypothetical protein